MDTKKNKKVKVIILILTILLGISLCALAGTLINLTKNQPASVVVPQNIITTEEENFNSDVSAENTDIRSETTKPDINGINVSSQTSTNHSKTVATALKLHTKQPQDNKPFLVGNMFPGDKETKYYCIHVSHKGKITVRFYADIQDGYEKLAEVLKTKVVLKSTGKTLYDGFIKDMPSSLNHTLTTNKSVTSELYYQITVYLETSVGNEYMEKDLKADFKWWVEETDNLDPPSTGDISNITVWFIVILALATLLLLLFLKRKKEEQDAKR